MNTQSLLKTGSDKNPNDGIPGHRQPVGRQAQPLPVKTRSECTHLPSPSPSTSNRTRRGHKLATAVRMPVRVTIKNHSVPPLSEIPIFGTFASFCL